MENNQPDTIAQENALKDRTASLATAAQMDAIITKLGTINDRVAKIVTTEQLNAAMANIATAAQMEVVIAKLKILNARKN